MARNSRTSAALWLLTLWEIAAWPKPTAPAARISAVAAANWAGVVGRRDAVQRQRGEGLQQAGFGFGRGGVFLG